MHKIIFEFSETVRVLDDTTMTVEATNAEILFATVVLINSLVDSMRNEKRQEQQSLEVSNE